jgi:hypothetical protein
LALGITLSGYRVSAVEITSQLQSGVGLARYYFDVKMELRLVVEGVCSGYMKYVRRLESGWHLSFSGRRLVDGRKYLSTAIDPLWPMLLPAFLFYFLPGELSGSFF